MNEKKNYFKKLIILITHFLLVNQKERKSFFLTMNFRINTNNTKKYIQTLLKIKYLLVVHVILEREKKIKVFQQLNNRQGMQINFFIDADSLVTFKALSEENDQLSIITENSKKNPQLVKKQFY